MAGTLIATNAAATNKAHFKELSHNKTPLSIKTRQSDAACLGRPAKPISEPLSYSGQLPKEAASTIKLMLVNRTGNKDRHQKRKHIGLQERNKQLQTANENLTNNTSRNNHPVNDIALVSSHCNEAQE